MSQDKAKITTGRRKAYIILIPLILALAAVGYWYLLPSEKPLQEKPLVSSVSIGCDRVIWKDTELELAASTQNIDKPLFEWTIDGRIESNSQKFNQRFDMGEHKVILKVSFDNNTLTANQSITVIDSADGISLRNFAASKSQWGFQTTYKGKDAGVKGALISIDSSPTSEVNPCGYLSTKGLFAGEHSWKAEYRGFAIASGNFSLKELGEVKINKIESAPSYTAGDTVNGKIVVKNTGTVIVTGFDIKTQVINNNFAWMGDKAKREYFDQYNSNLKPGEVYEVPIRITIPEKVSGIRPSGKYTITITLTMKGQVMDTKVINTEVK